MNYELAKELQQAGFRQFGEGHALILHDPLPESDQTMSVISWRDFIRMKLPKAWLYAPTLEELIEACGWRFICLGRSDDGKDYFATGSGEPLFPPLHEGSTPSEAVAMLWLALNPKQQ